jgi:hypothetical protein
MKKLFKGIAYLLGLLAFGIFGLWIYVEFTTHQFTSKPTFRTHQKQFAPPDTTEVYVLGLTHKPTALINCDSLYNALEIIKPDLILYEFDSTAFDKDMRLNFKYMYLLPSFLSKYQSNETMAFSKYLKFNPNVLIRPYEWNQRVGWHNKNNKAVGKMFDAVYERYDAGKLSPPHKAIVDNFNDLTKRLDGYADSSIFVINTEGPDSLAELRQNCHYHQLPNIINEDKYFDAFKDISDLNSHYWDVRNKAMAANICQFISLYPRKRIVVFNGFFHRYYLRKELMDKQANLNFKLLEINQLRE